MRRAAVLALVAIAVAAPTRAHAENPVYDAETGADIAAAFAEATQVQGVCYSVTLDVSDPSSIYGGLYVVSSSGIDVPPAAASCSRGTVELRAMISYASEYSDATDTASWLVDSSLGGPTETDLAVNGFSAQSLLDDAKSEQVLLNAALALPRLTAEAVDGVPPLVLTPATASPPADAQATGRPGSDAWRQSKTSIVLLGVVALGSIAWAVSLLRRPRRSWDPHPPYTYRNYPQPDDLPRPELI